MRPIGKRNLLGVLVDAVDYDHAVTFILDAAEQRRGFAVTALAVHGVMTGVQDDIHRQRLNAFDLVTPDGQPVRWALNLLHKTGLKDRVYGPTLTLKVCEAAAESGVPIYLYGSRQDVLDNMVANLTERFPGLVIAGAEPSKFRQTTAEEKREIAERIKASGAKITFVGLGCPRQEVFAYEYRDLLSMPVIAVGAAFDYHAGLVSEPPDWIQGAGLQWLYRLVQNPRRLWRRYLLLNPVYTTLVFLHWAGLRKPDLRQPEQSIPEVRYG
ncbi:MAG TPA: WecB/TagA/CpsF family glycosyltransferase [Thermomicrobiales bacterium]|nr:WecB/TagA/CpsF family glycosyltransferase [Thermomicrobiales bacterium]